MQTRCALVGMPGSGKSTVGRHLARRLDVPFVDLDQRMESVLGTSIRSYFEQHGEDSFRERETALMAEIAAEPGDMVLSTGGGIVLRQPNRVALRDFGHVLYLRASPDEIFKRVRHDKARPLLQVANPLERLRELYAVRDPLYREVAHFTVETGRPTVSTLVNMIIMQLDMAA
ncbi:shikimate kinase [Acidovorax sp. FG27]|uniref:shikimate kinase n=1 Tax=Acidovorax sp. FG27 TaxID=3133652 RepID=UPI0030E9EB58